MINRDTIEALAKRSTKAMDQALLKSKAERAGLLRGMADEIEALGDELLQTASAESNLPIVRFQGERGRTCSQLRMFADAIQNGSYEEAVIDTAIQDRQPLPKPDLRSALVPIGPVVVFGASNFPLAYSTAGGDTASALAAGCSVIYKAHPAHPKTSAIVAAALAAAIKKHGFPQDLFIHFEARDFEEVKILVQHSAIKAVGFTGSLKGGMAIHEYAQRRKDPIPVFAEMGSVNPVLLLPSALRLGANQWAETYAAAITVGVGQFCTNPGLLFGIKGAELDNFKDTLAQKIEQIRDFKMLNEGIFQNFVDRKTIVTGSKGVAVLAQVAPSAEGTGTPVVATVKADEFRAQSTLHEEVFGPFSLLVECEDVADILSCIAVLGGQLTSTIVAAEQDEMIVNTLMPILTQKAGRVIYNGVPTGVEVCDAMVHGGPFPATTDARFTAVGNKAIRRWLRPVAFQNWPEHLLPSCLRNENPNGSWRTINGLFTQGNVE
ncbi:MAG: aldehyde dehydrogenase (NADP(+)) [Saprospiraceae bacterium]